MRNFRLQLFTPGLLLLALSLLIFLFPRFFAYFVAIILLSLSFVWFFYITKFTSHSGSTYYYNDGQVYKKAYSDFRNYGQTVYVKIFRGF